MIEVRLAALKETAPHQYVLRFLFGGLCTAVAGLIARRFGPAVGGLFLAFPAIFPAGASLIESHERAKKREIGADGTVRGRVAAGSDAAGAALGCVGLMMFGFLVWKTIPKMHALWSVAIASLAWVIVAPLLWELRKRRFLTRHRS